MVDIHRGPFSCEPAAKIGMNMRSATHALRAVVAENGLVSRQFSPLDMLPLAQHLTSGS